jgi:ribosomal protein L40E
MTQAFKRAMLDPLLPLATLLAGTGFGDLIKKIIYVRRSGQNADATETQGRPRIQITGPKVQPEICQICMGKIKEGSEYVRCGTGKVFHSVCLARVGNCPYCSRTFAIKGRESTTSRNYIQPTVPRDTVEGPPTASPEARCPVCGGTLEKDATNCRSCGAIFVADGGTFRCPSCGFLVRESDTSCSRCGEPFHQFRPRTCPVCDRVIGPNDETCACGAILNDRCPECGAKLPDGATECGTCGAAFEFV